ncbi:hypothetical protein P691DRAFT_766731 [Macrolepiota fuliginosa MF-IS2]|uniref:Uncharacterized protein n=1 Tax=Macrolepiota fuliginosa MF-IS2 TaxID=1400762 RepID=A0A9P6BWV9_9AGAR|nr:hypothetical protein P691DRAFT_766731 [Macrolepiota fuliginosa MF-IS2]
MEDSLSYDCWIIPSNSSSIPYSILDLLPYALATPPADNPVLKGLGVSDRNGVIKERIVEDISKAFFKTSLDAINKPKPFYKKAYPQAPHFKPYPSPKPTPSQKKKKFRKEKPSEAIRAGSTELSVATTPPRITLSTSAILAIASTSADTDPTTAYVHSGLSAEESAIVHSFEKTINTPQSKDDEGGVEKGKDVNMEERPVAD